EAYCRKEEITFVRLPPKTWDSTFGPAEAEVNVRKFREIIDDPDNYPILVHCFAGIHRTGAYIAIYRMEREHCSNDEAIAEVKAAGYDIVDVKLAVLGYLKDYRPTWKQAAEPPPASPEQEKEKAVPKVKKRVTKGAKKSPRS